MDPIIPVSGPKRMLFSKLLNFSCGKLVYVPMVRNTNVPAEYSIKLQK